MSVKVRFAPSPTGLLHVGNIRAALINWLFARKQGGEFLLRLDDTDPERSRPEFAGAIQEDLSWLGLNWDDLARQSDRLERYDAAAERLKADGRLYACYETAEELELKRKIQLARKLPPVYDREGLKLSEEKRALYEKESRRPHWRFKLETPARIEWQDGIRGPVGIDLVSLSDPVLVREDGSYLYTLPSVVDDVDFAISHVIRGEDHVTNSAVQVQIFEALGAQAPNFAHFALLTGAEGGGLSKRDGALSIRDLREKEGIEAMAILSLLARLGTSLPVEPFSALAPLINSFDLSAFTRASAKFDPAELRSLNAKILHGLDFADVKERLGIDDMDEGLWNAIRPNLERLQDAKAWHDVVKGPIDPVIEDRTFINEANGLFPNNKVTDETWSVWTKTVKEETGRKGRELFLPLRLALTGLDHGPEMKALLPLIGAERAKARLRGERA